MIHAIVDNYATHKQPKIQKWLAKHPRWTFHFAPTSASWLNAVEGFFAKLTTRRLKPKARHVPIGRRTRNRHRALHRKVPMPKCPAQTLRWTARPSRILAAVKRGKQTLESLR